MALAVPVFLVSLFCSWFQCEFGAQPPYVYFSNKNTKAFQESVARRSGVETYEQANDGPIAYTKLGLVEGFVVNISDHRQIVSFTGVKYGEKPERFRPPKPKKPWKGVLKATSPSTFCIQASAVTMGMVRGEEDCLYLDIHTPRLPIAGKKHPGLPVLIWLPAGANMYGRSRTFGPAYLLREDIILVVLNVRFGVFGYLSTGDAASPGNYGLKDQALACAFVYENIAAFGGDPNKITVGGLSSGAYTAHLMLFTNHIAKNYVAGIFAMSGTALGNHGFDTVGRVQKASDIVAKSAGCPTSSEGRSKEMVECLRKMDPYLLATKQTDVYKEMPAMSKMIGPTLEPDLPGAFITEIPEVQYAKGIVPRIPAIFSRSEDESSLTMEQTRNLMLPIVRLNYYEWMPRLLQIGVRSGRGYNIFDDESDEAQYSLLRVNQFYFNKTTPPRIRNKQDFRAFSNMIGDTLYHAPMWKAVKLHHKIAPTYVYLNKHKTMSINPIYNVFRSIFPTDAGASHATDFVLVFNYTNSIPTLAPGSDFEIASRNLVNMIANFCAYGKPLYRTPTGNLVDIWKPIKDMEHPMVLDVGLVHNISMIRDPLPGTGRLKIWDEVKF